MKDWLDLVTKYLGVSMLAIASCGRAPVAKKASITLHAYPSVDLRAGDSVDRDDDSVEGEPVQKRGLLF